MDTSTSVDRCATTISSMCRDYGGRTHFAYAKMIDDYLVLAAKILAIRKVLETIVRER